MIKNTIVTKANDDIQHSEFYVTYGAATHIPKRPSRGSLKRGDYFNKHGVEWHPALEHKREVAKRFQLQLKDSIGPCTTTKYIPFIDGTHEFMQEVQAKRPLYSAVLHSSKEEGIWWYKIDVVVQYNWSEAYKRKAVVSVITAGTKWCIWKTEARDLARDIIAQYKDFYTTLEAGKRAELGMPKIGDVRKSRSIDLGG